MKHLLLVALAVVASQTQQIPKPTFETGVDIIQVDVHVVDRSGKPIVDLRPEEFEVEISGKKRKIDSVQFISYKAPLAKPDPGAPAETAAHRPRRMFIIAVDEHSLQLANAAAAVNAAERFIDRLQPDDLVGLFAYPTGVAKHDLTDNHASVRSMLPKIGGLFAEPANKFNLTPSEIIECANNDNDALRRVVARECPMGGCSMSNIRQDAISLVGFMEMKVSQSLGGLRNLVAGLKAIPGRKTLVLVSGGLVTTDQAGGRANSGSEIQQVGREAALANVSVFALHLDWSFLESVSSRGGLRTSYFRDSNMAVSGLENVAGTAGGTVFRVQGTSPNVAFDRVLTETSAHYLLGVAGSDADRDGQPHSIRVKVKRRGAQVRSRTELVVPKG